MSAIDSGRTERLEIWRLVARFSAKQQYSTRLMANFFADMPKSTENLPSHGRDIVNPDQHRETG
jgi:hypothetical protein